MRQPLHEIPQLLLNAFLLLRKLVRKWVTSAAAALVNAIHSFTWKGFLESLGVAVAVWGGVLGLLTYRSQYIASLRQASETAFYHLIEDLGSSARRVRIGALSRLPGIMVRRVPLSDTDIPMRSLLWNTETSLGQTPIYHDDARELLYIHLRNLSTDRELWSTEEVEAILNTVAKIGFSAWYYAGPLAPDPNKQIGLEWLWTPQVPHTDNRYQNAFTFLSGVRLDGVDFSKRSLSRCYFRASSLNGSVLDTTNLQGGDLQDAQLRGASLQFAQLANANLTAAHFENADLSSARLSYALLRRAVLNDATLPEVIADNSDFVYARLGGASLHKANFSSSRMNFVYMDNAYASEAIFENADLSFATIDKSILDFADLKQASLHGASCVSVDFSHADVEGADFSLANLANAKMTGVRNILNAKSWADTNIANVKGLSKEITRALLTKGAVEIPRTENWKKYKQDGRPHEKWKKYAR